MEKVEIYPLSDKFKDIYNTLLFSDKTYLMLEGAVRSGKSYTANFCGISYIEKLKSPANILVSGRTRGTRKQNILSEWEILLGIEFKRSNDARGEYYTIPLPQFKGKKIYVRGRDKQTDFKKIQGMTLDFWYRDERTNHHESFFNMRLSRLSKGHSKRMFTCNPDSPHHYLKVNFIDKRKEDEEFASFFKSWSFLMVENPSLTESYKNKMKKRYQGVFYDRFIRGLWVLAEGLIYDNFDKNKFVLPYNKKEIEEMKKQGQIYIGCDYGTLNATVFLKFLKIKNKFYLIEEYYHSGRNTSKQKTTAEYVEEMKKFIGNDIVKHIYIDPSARYFKTDLIKNNIKNIVNAKNEVLKGIREVQNTLNENNLYIFSNCKETIKEFETYSWDEKASLKGEDIPLKINDHTMDRLRYTIVTAPKTNGPRGMSY